VPGRQEGAVGKDGHRACRLHVHVCGGTCPCTGVWRMWRVSPYGDTHACMPADQSGGAALSKPGLHARRWPATHAWGAHSPHAHTRTSGALLLLGPPLVAAAAAGGVVVAPLAAAATAARASSMVATLSSLAIAACCWCSLWQVDADGCWWCWCSTWCGRNRRAARATPVCLWRWTAAAVGAITSCSGGWPQDMCEEWPV
jgi:hypothetical protein